MARTALSTAVLLVCFAAGCGVPRPAGLPAEAHWVPQQKPGAFVLVGSREARGWRVTVWDRKGRVLADGPFVLEGMARATLESAEVTAWDGRQLSLGDGTLLRPVP